MAATNICQCGRGRGAAGGGTSSEIITLSCFDKKRKSLGQNQALQQRTPGGWKTPRNKNTSIVIIGYAIFLSK